MLPWAGSTIGVHSPKDLSCMRKEASSHRLSQHVVNIIKKYSPWSLSLSLSLSVYVCLCLCLYSFPFLLVAITSLLFLPCFWLICARCYHVMFIVMQARALFPQQSRNSAIVGGRIRVNTCHIALIYAHFSLADTVACDDGNPYVATSALERAMNTALLVSKKVSLTH